MADWDMLRLPRDWLWVQSVAAVSIAVLFALAAHWLTIRLILRAGSRLRRPQRTAVLARVRRPLQWLFVAVAVSFVSRALPMDRDVREMWERGLGFVFPALMGWFAIGLVDALRLAVELNTDITVEDNLAARRRRTRVQILGRIGSFFIAFVTVCLMLLSVPGIRTIGVTLMASAGIAGLVVGAAAQPALKNLIAGIQMAFTEPIRLDDVVIMDGEWGRIEEIRLTFVVIRLWDERRLVVPVSKFLETSFQNWTRETSQLLGSVFWYFDPATDIEALRTIVGRAVEASDRWDHRFWNCQVTDVTADAIQVRGLMTAKDASTAFDLRCEVREAVLAEVRAQMPEALPRKRVLMGERETARQEPPHQPPPSPRT